MSSMDRTTIRLPPPRCFCGLPATTIFPDPEPEPDPRSQPSSQLRNKNLHNSQHPLRNGHIGPPGPQNSNSHNHHYPSPWVPSSRYKRQEYLNPSFYVSNPKFPDCNWVYECFYTPDKENPQILDETPLFTYQTLDRSLDKQKKSSDLDPSELTPQSEIRPWDERLPTSPSLWVGVKHERTAPTADSIKGHYDHVKTKDTRIFSPVSINSVFSSPDSSTLSSIASSSSSPSTSSLSAIKEDQGDHHEIEYKPSDHDPRVRQVTDIMSIKGLNASFFATATPNNRKYLDYKNPDLRVCGFHMHGLEWHKMQKLDIQDQITLVERAQCPIFNLSVTRWMKNGANHLQKEPFNTIFCHCGEPMVVALDISNNAQEGYSLVCPKSLPGCFNMSGSEPIDVNNSLNYSGWSTPRGKQGPLKDDSMREGLQTGNEQKKYREQPHGSCSKVIPVNDVKYPPRSYPIHPYLQIDEWTERCFWPRPGRLSYFIPSNLSPDKGHNVKSALNQTYTRYPQDFSKFTRREGFKRQRSVSFNSTPKIIPPVLETKAVYDGSSKGDGKHESSSHEKWPNPDWCDKSMLISDSIQFEPLPTRDELWCGENLQSLDSWGVLEMSDDLFRLSLNKAIKGADEYVNQYEQKVLARLEIQKSRRKEIDNKLDEITSEAAKLAIEVKRMDENAKEMPHKCRICFENFSTHAVVPCFHLVMCEVCVNLVDDCIICRVPKIDVQRIYWG